MEAISELDTRIRDRLARLYPDRFESTCQALQSVMEDHRAQYAPATATETRSVDQRDVVLITYADQIQERGVPAISLLHRFLREFELLDLFSAVHLLPFYPYSSDDGFSVIDYRAIAEGIGDWSDVRSLGDDIQLMFDLVLNHCSRESQWFADYCRRISPFDRFFVDVDPCTDVSDVVRPRTHPLLTPFETDAGTRHVWTTFSEDQVDLDFAEPDVLVEMVSVLLFHVRQGATIIRLDAIAYLWKRLGSTCIHLPETHEVVKLLRDVLDAVAPQVWLITETNVPHAENVSYFGDGDEADWVYQFSLPPLLLDAFLNSDSDNLSRWLENLDPPPRHRYFFNFTASHDGIGVRPLEGLVAPKRIHRLVEHARALGGRVGMKRNRDGSESPYELNITYFDMLGAPEGLSSSDHVRRFLSSQAIMLGLPGVPGVYVQSLLGGRNDLAGVAASGIPRRINRRKFEWKTLAANLRDSTIESTRVLHSYRELIARRRSEPCFHPDAECRLLDTGDRRLFGFERQSVDGRRSVHCMTNLSSEPLHLSAEVAGTTFDLIGQQRWDQSVPLRPYQTVWLASA